MTNDNKSLSPAFSVSPCLRAKNDDNRQAMIVFQPITAENAFVFKEVRLRALRDTPSAFGSSYERESQLPDAEWIARAVRWNGDKGIGFLAMDDGIACGIVGSFLDEGDPTRAQLISMWTAPTHRGQGVGRFLVDEVAAWARQRGARTLQLMVTSVNEPAMRFYERLGFTRTGRTGPYPNDPNVIEYEMARAV
jgi:ribosomal protein S18 acetylase RimI-like enzyme